MSAVPTRRNQPTVADVLDQIAQTLADRPEWMDRGLCKKTDPEAFFPEKGGSTREAKAICDRCPVKPDCRQYALDRGERFGIWGGLSERERRNLKRNPGPHTGREVSRDVLEQVARMDRRGTPVPHIARHLNVSERQVHRARAALRREAAA